MHNEAKIPYELQRIADALEANNELQKQLIELTKKNTVLFEKNLKDNDDRHKEAMELSVRNVELTQAWMDWSKQSVIDIEEQQRLSEKNIE